MRFIDVVLMLLVIAALCGFILYCGGCAHGKASAQGNTGQAAILGNQATGADSTATTAAFNPHDMGTAKAGRDLATSLSFVGGNIGLTILGGILASGFIRAHCVAIRALASVAEIER